MKSVLLSVLRVSLLSLCVTFLSGCVSQNTVAKFNEFEKLGITKATITGKFSNTEYTVTKASGVRKAVIDHSNAWMPKIHIERETPVENQEARIENPK